MLVSRSSGGKSAFGSGRVVRHVQALYATAVATSCVGLLGFGPQVRSSSEAAGSASTSCRTAQKWWESVLGGRAKGGEGVAGAHGVQGVGVVVCRVECEASWPTDCGHVVQEGGVQGGLRTEVKGLTLLQAQMNRAAVSVGRKILAITCGANFTMCLVMLDALTQAGHRGGCRNITRVNHKS